MSSNLIRYKGYLNGHQEHNEKVVTIVMDIPSPISSTCHSEAEWHKALGGILRSTYKDIKHSGAWDCHHCREPAHETIHTPLLSLPGRSWVPRPLVLDQIFFVCRDGGECRAVIDAETKAVAATVLKAEHKDLSPASLRAQAGETGPSKEPRAATCATCFKGGKVMQCGKCRMIRYCSRECQIADYSRHKLICAMIKKVESNPESVDLTKVFD